MEEQLGHYKIIGRLGKGGMGTVYKAHEISLNRTVAIKVLAEHLAEDKTHVARFVREAQSAAALSHPNVIQIHFIGEDQGKHYFVMEYVRGESLKELLKREKRLSIEKSLAIVRQAATGLAAAHELGLVHRDIKPANIMLAPDSTVKIADFGLAFAPQGGEKLTATGMFLGTPGYVAPEQCSGEPLDQRTDIYALGVTLYEMLAGKSAFETESLSPMALIHQVMHQDPKDLKTLNPDLDDAACAIVKKMMAKSPKDRYENCRSLLRDIEAYQSGSKATEIAAVVAPPPMPPPVVPPVPPQGESAERAVAPPPVEVPRVASVQVPKRSSSTAWVIGLSAAAVIVALAVLGVVFRDRLFGTSLTAGAVEESVAEEMPAIADSSGAEQLAEEDIAVETDAAETEGSDQPEELAAWVQTDSEGAGDSQDVETLQATASEAVAHQVTSESMGQVDDQTEMPEAPSERAATTSVAQELGGTVAHRDVTDVEEETDSTPPPTEPRAAARSDRVAPDLNPTVCVIAVGDRLIARPLERHLEAAFAGTPFEVVDEELVAEVDDLLRANPDDVRLGTLMPLLRTTDARFLVLARVEFLEQRTLQYMGRSSQAYLSRVTITPYSVLDEKPVGEKFQDQVEYTTLNAERKAEQLALRFGDGVRQKIRQAWMRNRR